MPNRADVDAAVTRMERTAACLEADRARLSSAMWGIYRLAGFKGLVGAVSGELQRMAAKLGPSGTDGWVG